MSILPIIIGADNPILRQKTKKVTKVSKEVEKLAQDMLATMVEANGIGIAAPQVGSNLRLCLAPINGKTKALINPEITWKSDKTDVDEEGCLSLPGVLVPVTRSTSITLTYTDLKGVKQERKLEGLEARVVLHETDHLDGVLIVDYK